MTPTRIVDPLPVQVSRPMVLLRLGYRRPAQVPEKVARLIDADSGKELFAVTPFGETFTGGLNVAVGDVTGDTVPDLIVAPRTGGGQC